MPSQNWIDAIPQEDRDIYLRAGFRGAQTFGARPALLVVDVTYGFTGSPGLTLDQAIAEFSSACGPVAWATMPHIARLIDLFRRARRPIVFSCSDSAATPFVGKATKSKRSLGFIPRFNDFPSEIEPRDGEWVLTKTKASAFFGTPLSTFLVREGVDCLVVCGVSTSGCVRASVVDSFSHGFNTFVVEDCCFDRSWFAHCANLYDMDSKYAAAVSLEKVEALLGRLAPSNILKP